MAVLTTWVAVLVFAVFAQLGVGAPIDRKGILGLLLDLLTKKNDNVCVC